MNKLILSCFLAAMIMACAGKENAKANSGDLSAGEHVYKKYCVICHGQDGRLGVNGSKDITVSTLTKGERIELIKNGKSLMTPFEGILSEAEIAAVAAYTMTMK